MGAFAGAGARDNPFESFIGERIKYRKLTGQFVIALVAGLGLAGGMVGLYSLMYPTEAEPIYGGLLFVMMIIYTLVPLGLWFGVSTISFVAARLLGARAEFGTVFRATGWGLIPLVGATVTLSLGRYLSLSGTYTNVCDHPTIVCGFAEQVSITEQVAHVFALSGSVSTHTAFVGSFVLAAGFYVLTWYFMAIAADEASTLTRAGGMVTVGVPMAVVGAIYTMNTFF